MGVRYLELIDCAWYLRSLGVASITLSVRTVDSETEQNDVKISSKCLCGFELHGCINRKGDFQVPCVNYFFVHMDRLSKCKITCRTRWWWLEDLKGSVFVFGMYYISRVSALIESSDSMILWESRSLEWYHETLKSPFFQVFTNIKCVYHMKFTGINNIELILGSVKWPFQYKQQTAHLQWICLMCFCTR